MSYYNLSNLDYQWQIRRRLLHLCATNHRGQQWRVVRVLQNADRSEWWWSIDVYRCGANGIHTVRVLCGAILQVGGGKTVELSVSANYGRW